MKWLPAMKKVKLNISMVPPSHPSHGVFKLLKGQVGSIVGFFYTALEFARIRAAKIAVLRENWPNTIDTFNFTLFIYFQIAGNHFVV